MGNVRQPKKVNSIEKKNKIIEAGLKVFGEKGYYKTNTAEIAKIAGVSTGIVYSYFKDKKDILLQVLDLYFDKIFKPIEKYLEKTNTQFKIGDFVENLIEISLKSHKINATTHEEMLALSHLDEDVHELFIENEKHITNKLISYLENNGVKLTNIKERVHMSYNIVESLCHEIIYHEHNYINYNIMIEQTKQTLINLLKF